MLLDRHSSAVVKKEEHTQRIISVAVSFKKTTCNVSVLVEVKKEEHTPIRKKIRSLALTYL